ncbi:MAG: hypothetical protein HOQ22_09685 [Nocardioidaceae bacterium]|nr:hypothetical protein [Nocardioidaceae bacterium]NUS51293.1 hypothetical protein [Nocardioidaceae bacterium]
MGCRDEVAQLKHDLRQYVAAGELLTRMPDDAGLTPDVRFRLERLVRLFDGMGELVEMGTGGPGRSVDVSELVRECAEVVGVSGGLCTDHAGSVATSDPALLRRALVNVMANAVRAAGDGGEVTVTVLGRADDAVVEVTDDGAGIGAVATVSGQGLMVVNQALRACGGSLAILSTPDRGTTVRLVLPRRAAGEGARR